MSLSHKGLIGVDEDDEASGYEDMGESTLQVIRPQNEPLSFAKLGEEALGTDTARDLYVNCSDIDEDSTKTPQSAAAVLQRERSSSASEKEAKLSSQDTRDFYQNMISMNSPKQGEPASEAIYWDTPFDQNQEVYLTPVEQQSKTFENIYLTPVEQQSKTFGDIHEPQDNVYTDVQEHVYTFIV